MTYKPGAPGDRPYIEWLMFTGSMTNTVAHSTHLSAAAVLARTFSRIAERHSSKKAP